MKIIPMITISSSFTIKHSLIIHIFNLINHYHMYSFVHVHLHYLFIYRHHQHVFISFHFIGGCYHYIDCTIIMFYVYRLTVGQTLTLFFLLLNRLHFNKKILIIHSFLFLQAASNQIFFFFIIYSHTIC